MLIPAYTATCCIPGCTDVTYAGHKTCGTHTPVDREPLYRVWQAVTATPHASVTELARAADVSHTTTQRALRQLAQVGAIEHEEGAARARRIIEPFCWVRV